MNVENFILIDNIHINQIEACGYCEKDNGKWTSSGFVCDNMNISDYFHLLNRGFRRCGTYYYKPNVDQCCCKPYQIRMNPSNYILKKKQRKVLKRFQAYLSQNYHENNKKQLHLIFNKIDQFFSNIVQDITNFIQILGFDITLVTQEEIQIFQKYDFKSKHFKKNRSQFIKILYLIQTSFWSKFQICSFEFFLDKVKNLVQSTFNSIINDYKVYLNKQGTIIFIQTDSQCRYLDLLDGQFDIYSNQYTQILPSTLIQKQQKKQFQILFVKASFQEESFQLYRKYLEKIHFIKRVNSI